MGKQIGPWNIEATPEKVERAGEIARELVTRRARYEYEPKPVKLPQDELMAMSSLVAEAVADPIVAFFVMLSLAGLTTAWLSAWVDARHGEDGDTDDDRRERLQDALQGMMAYMAAEGVVL